MWFLDDFLLLEDEYYHAAYCEDRHDDDQCDDAAVHACLDGEAVFRSVDELICCAYLILAGFGDLIAELVSDLLAGLGYLNGCILGEVTDNYGILGFAAVLYAVKGDRRCGCINRCILSWDSLFRGALQAFFQAVLFFLLLSL